jgi:pimeloyl-ACP methyl ester carboxylesterase
MARPILMPQVGQDLTEGKIVALNVKLGDMVKKGDIVAEVESEKATFEVEAFETGFVIDMRYVVGDMAIVLQPLMLVGDEGEVVATTKSVEAAAMPIADLKKSEPPISAVQGNVKSGSSPLARRLAEEAGVDIHALVGSGPDGVVVKKDISALKWNDATTNATTLPSVVRSLRSGVGDPVVFIHGFGADLSAWRPFVLQLQLANPILALDLPAHGVNPDTTCDDFKSLCAAVQTTMISAGLKRVHLVGHSLGAAVATEIASLGNLTVQSLCLISPAGLGPWINGDYVEGFLSANSEPALKTWLEVLLHTSALVTGAMVRATFAARENSAMVVNQRKLAGGLFSGNTQLFSIREALATFEKPVRVIVGKEDRIIPSHHLQSLPGSTALHQLSQVGHLPQLEAVALTARLVAETVRSSGASGDQIEPI